MLHNIFVSIFTAQKVLESNKPSKDSTTEKSETVGKVEKKDVLSVEMKKKTQEKSSTKKEKQKGYSRNNSKFIFSENCVCVSYKQNEEK